VRTVLALVGTIPLAVAGLLPLGGAQAAAAPIPAPAGGDAVHVVLPAAAGQPALDWSDVTSGGGLSVLDDLADGQRLSVSGRTALAGGGRLSVDLRRPAPAPVPAPVATPAPATPAPAPAVPIVPELAGTIDLQVPGQDLTVTATVSGGVQRPADDTVAWSGTATVTVGGSSTVRPISVTIVDRVLDPGDHAVHLTHAGQVRLATVHVPTGRSGADGTAPAALFHFPGLRETGPAAESTGQLRAHADRFGYLMVIPEHFGPGWQGVLAGTPSPDVDDPGFVRALAGVVQQRFGADPNRTYASGMSNGGFFTSLTACSLNDVFAAFAPVSGQVANLDDPASCRPGRAVPIVMFHGDADPIVGYNTAPAAQEFWAKNNGCQATTDDTELPDRDPDDGTRVVRHVSRGCPAGAPVELYQIVGGGHTWPGGNPYPVDLGKLTKDVTANDVIWDFVSRFTLR
jgi:poly(3-hydroxybutyrate) depolymerase